MIKAGIIGATGYAGGELVRLLQGHKNEMCIRDRPMAAGLYKDCFLFMLPLLFFLLLLRSFE